MKKTIITLIILFTGIIFTLGQSPLGFNYQSVIRDADGAVIADTEIAMRMGIVQTTIDGTAVYTETHSATTNAFGLVNIVIGQGTLVSGNFATIDWGADNYFLQVEIDLNNSGSFTEIGTSQLLSVPFANYAFTSGGSDAGWIGTDQAVSTDKKVGIGTSNPTSSLQIVASQKQQADEPIFEVKNAAGKTVFAVFENEVKVYIDDTEASPGFTVSKRDANDLTEEIMAVGPQKTNIFVGDNPGKAAFGGFAISGRTTTKEIIDILSITPELTEFFIAEPNTKAAFGGFAISGRTTTKAIGQNLLNITPSLTKFTIEQPTKAAFGGFAISGRTTTKGVEVDVLTITPDYTRFYVDEPNEKAAFGGFAISGRTTTKGINDEIFKVTPSLTEVFIDENQTKAAFGGFAISGRTTTKGAGLYDIFRVQPHKTDIYLKKSETKGLPDGFSIYGLNANLESTELFTVSDSGTFVNTTMAVAPKVFTNSVGNTTQTSAFVSGAVIDDNGIAITQVGIIYSITPTLNVNLDFSNPANAGMILGDPMTPENIFGNIENLTPGTPYFFRVFAVNAEGLVGYGAVEQFTTWPPNTVTFIVEDASEQPINNAVITVTSFNSGYSTTNEIGNYIFELAEGPYACEVYAPGYFETSQEISVTGDNMITITLTSGAPPRTTFHVTDGVANVFDARVELSGDSISTPIVYYTNENGIAYFQMNGTWDYTVDSDGYVQSTGSFTVGADDQTIEVGLTALPKRAVTFNVTYQPQQVVIPAVGANVTVNYGVKGIYDYSRTLQTDAAGQVVFDDVPDGEFFQYSIELGLFSGYGPIEQGGDKTIPVTLMSK